MSAHDDGAMDIGSPRVSVVVAARMPPDTIERALASLCAQTLASDIEVILADGSSDGSMAAWLPRFPRARQIRLPGGNLPLLKSAAVKAAAGTFVAMLDPTEAADPDWIEQILDAFRDPAVTGVGGAVLLDDESGAANVAAYLFEYGAFNPPLVAGQTQDDLPGNNVAYRRAALTPACDDLLASEGFYKPLLHERIRANGGRLLIRPAMRVRHLTRHRFIAFGARRFHYGRCFGAVRLRHASRGRKALYVGLAPAVVPLLIVRNLRRAFSHVANRRLLPRAALALCGVCVCWGFGEWLGCWFGAGRSCEKLY